MRAGFFNSKAINYYIFWRLAVVVLLPGGAYLLAQQFMGQQPWFAKLGLVVVAMLIAIMGPDAYLRASKTSYTSAIALIFLIFWI